jgi:hypothetical protein
MRHLPRREFLDAGGIAGLASVSGCLRTVGSGSEGATPSTDGLAFAVQHAWGPREQREVRWEDDRAVVVCGDESPDAGDVEGESAVGADVAVGTTQRVDPAGVSRIVYAYRHRWTPGEGISRDEANEDVSYLALARDLVDLAEVRVQNADGSDSNIPASMYLKNREDTDRVEREIDVSDVSGRAFLGFGANVGSSLPQAVTLDVFEVRGVDAAGEKALGLDAANRTLSFAWRVRRQGVFSFALPQPAPSAAPEQTRSTRRRRADHDVAAAVSRPCGRRTVAPCAES